MLKQLRNECIIHLHIQPDGPLLIKSGIATVSGPDMAFVRTRRNGEWQVYLPGSSLKGVLRSHAERLARSVKMPSACDPFTDAKVATQEPERAEILYCGERFSLREKGPPKETLSNPQLYADSCPICRLFGSTYYGSRLATADAYAVGSAPRPEGRDGVGIDRFTGGSSGGAKFDLEVITSGTFATTLHFRNFELWQLGLVGFVLQDLKDGLLRLGMGKSRGLGKVVGTVQTVRLDYLGSDVPLPQDGRLTVRGIGSLTPQAAAYGMVRPDEVNTEFDGEPQRNGVRTTYTFAGDRFPWADLGRRWLEYIESYTVPAAMNHSRFVGNE